MFLALSDGKLGKTLKYRHHALLLHRELMQRKPTGVWQSSKPHRQMVLLVALLEKEFTFLEH